MRRGRQNRIQNFEKDIFISISLVISTRMFKEMSRIRSNSARISAKTLQPALAAGCLFARCEGRPLAFFQTRAALVTMRCPQKKIV